MPDKKFDLGGYIEVKDRIAKFYELFAQGRLVTGEVRLTTEPDGVPRVLVQGLAYRTPDDPLPGQGWSWMALPGTTTYTRGSELENAETSAWGRAIGSLGILIGDGIASAQEVQNKAGQPTTARQTAETPVTHDGSLIGTAEVGKVGSGADFELRQSPEGPVAAFRLKQGRTGYKVVAHGALAIAVAGLRPEGQRVQVWGSMQDESFVASGGHAITYQVVNLERMTGDDFEVPAPEAPSLALFELTDDEKELVGAGVP